MIVGRGRRRLGVAAAAFAALAAFAPTPRVALAGPSGPSESEWRLDGDVRLQYERYDVTGLRSAGPYAFLGNQSFAQLHLGFERHLGPYHTWSGQLLGLVNDNDYRSPFDGVVTERLGFLIENGNHAIPYRIELGDSFAYFSHRTLFRTLKGVRLEIQTGPASTRFRSSLQVLSGVHALSWRDLRLKDDWTSGFSWLVESDPIGRFSVNFVDNVRDRSGAGPERRQHLYGLTGERRVRIGSEVLTLEGELSRLDGETDGTGTGTAGTETELSDNALYLQLSGRGRSSLTYRLRFESYGQDYSPAGAPILADRRSGEAHVGFRLPSGARLTSRWQRYRDFRETVNPADTNTVGVGLSGPFLGARAPALSGNLQFFVQDQESRDRILDQRVVTLSLDAYLSAYRAFIPRTRIFWQDGDDHTARQEDHSTLQIELGGDRPLGLAGFRGTFGPGLMVRRIRNGTTASDDLRPTVALNLVKGRHLLQQTLAVLTQDRREALNQDVRSIDYHLIYRWDRRRDTLGFDFDTLDRDPDPGRRTTSWRASLSWTHHLDTGWRGSGLARTLSAMTAGSRDATDLTHLRPGMFVDEARAHLEQARLPSPARIDDLWVYEARLLDEIESRQRVVLVERDGQLARAALLIDTGDLGNGDDLRRAFERVRERLVARYGSPSDVVESGEFAADLAGVDASLRAGTFLRITEWVRPEGVLRFGIPRRLDGQVRMELQLAEEFPSLRDPAWGIEAVR